MPPPPPRGDRELANPQRGGSRARSSARPLQSATPRTCTLGGDKRGEQAPGRMTVPQRARTGGSEVREARGGFPDAGADEGAVQCRGPGPGEQQQHLRPQLGCGTRGRGQDAIFVVGGSVLPGPAKAAVGGKDGSRDRPRPGGALEVSGMRKRLWGSGRPP